MVAYDAPAPALCSTVLRHLVFGPPRTALVAAAGEHALYLTMCTETNDVVALVGAHAVRLPLAMQVRELPAVVAASRAVVGAGRVTIGTRSWCAARWWDPRPRVNAGRLRTASSRLSGTPTDVGVDLHRAFDAVMALAGGDAGPAVTLLGDGPGFTPAGDDVVAGALATLALTDTLDAIAGQRVLTAAADRTTAISAALLACAARGQVIPPAGRTLTALSTDAADAVLVAAVDELCAVGATSGEAMLFGIATALASLPSTAEMGTS